jgi:hypothetical protein
MTACKSPEDATLLDILVNGFEKNEVLEGFHWAPTTDARRGGPARAKFSALIGEARRWKAG